MSEFIFHIFLPLCCHALAPNEEVVDFACETLIPTTSLKAISNHIKFLRGWCTYLDWCQRLTIVKIDTKKLKKRVEKN